MKTILFFAYYPFPLYVDELGGVLVRFCSLWMELAVPLLIPMLAHLHISLIKLLSNSS